VRFPLDRSFIAEIEEVLAGLGAPANGETSAWKKWPLPESAGCAGAYDQAICVGDWSGGGSMMRVMGGATVVAVGLMLAPVAAQAQTPALVNARVEISAAVAGSSATLEAIERQANARDRARQAEIAALQTRLTEAEGRGAAEVTALQAELIAAREALVADLSSRDPAYAEVIGLFRREVADIASTPEGAAALAQFNRGEAVAALAVLDRIIDANERAQQLAIESATRVLSARANRDIAAQRRAVAALAVDARFRGRLGEDEVILRYEEVVRLDPDQFADWNQLYGFYRGVGRITESMAALDRMRAVARNDLDMALALLTLAQVELSRGDREAAIGLYYQSLQLPEPNIGNQRGPAGRAVAVSGRQIVDPAAGYRQAKVASLRYYLVRDIRELGERDAALAMLERQLAVAERLLAADPGSPSRAKAVMDSLEDIAVFLKTEGRLSWTGWVNLAAEPYAARALEIAERLFVTDPGASDLAEDVRDLSGLVRETGGYRIPHTMRALQRELEIAERFSTAEPDNRIFSGWVQSTLITTGALHFRLLRYDAALAVYRRSLEIEERGLAADPASVEWLIRVSTALTPIGDILLVNADLEGALELFRRKLEIEERLAPRLAAAAPNLEGADDGVAFTLERIGDVLLSQEDRDGALELYRRSLEIAERLSAAEPAASYRARAVFVSSMRIARITGERRYWERALAILRDLDSKGALAEADRPFIAEIEGVLAGLGAPGAPGG
jgi:tetratricopeptide (TPR) repeat protein